MVSLFQGQEMCLHVTANHTAQLDLEAAVYALCSQCHIVTDAPNRLGDSRRI